MRGRVVLTDDRKIEFDYAMIVPPSVGHDVVKACTDIADEQGFVKVRSTYHTVTYPDVYAVGVAAAVDVPWQTPTPVGIPTTATVAQGDRRESGGVRDGCRQQRSHRSGRQPLAAEPSWCADSGSAGPR